MRGALNAPRLPAHNSLGPGNLDSPAFEVASVKPNKSRDGERSGDLVGRRFTMTYATLRDLVYFAYQRQDDGHLRYDSQISGGPSWINSDRFDVVANAEGMPAGLDASNTGAGAATSREIAGIDRIRLMMRTLLADRFKLTVHNELRELPIYALVIDRNDGKLGPQLRKVDVDCVALRESGSDAPCGGFRGLESGHYTGRAVSMTMVAGLLEGRVGRMVFDRTELVGKFDVDLQWTPEQAQRPGDLDLPPSDLNGPSIFTAVREQLGLKLESVKGPVEVLVIDSVEQPTPD